MYRIVYIILAFCFTQKYHDMFENAMNLFFKAISICIINKMTFCQFILLFLLSLLLILLYCTSDYNYFKLNVECFIKEFFIKYVNLLNIK